MENIAVETTFSDLPAEKYPVGFMDLLGVHQNISQYSLIHKPPIQLPETPKSSSSEAVTEKRYNEEDEDGEEQQHKRKKRVKSEKRSKKTKMRIPKVTFITKTEDLHLEDGYKWRKYGQKPVKNSPYPRHYYRCTTSWCDVKKRVERSFNDPSSVITTYEGQHTHFRPLIIMSKRSNVGSSAYNSASDDQSYFRQLPTLLPPQLFHYNNQQHELPIFGHDDDDDDEDNDGANVMMTKGRTRDFFDDGGLVKDHGLLQDIVSSHIIKQE